MYASIDFATKRELRQAVQQGALVVAYSPIAGMPAITGRAIVEGPWRPDRMTRGWRAIVDVRDMRVVKVH